MAWPISGGGGARSPVPGSPGVSAHTPFLSARPSSAIFHPRSEGAGVRRLASGGFPTPTTRTLLRYLRADVCEMEVRHPVLKAAEMQRE